MKHDEICSRLPHAGRMCLIDSLDHWDAESICCTTASHRRSDNPLRSGNILPPVAGIEYAAQAMALHGNLLAGPDSVPVMGYLASVRDCRISVEDLGVVIDDLQIVARRLSGDEQGLVYEFDIHSGSTSLLTGRMAARLIRPDR